MNDLREVIARLDGLDPLPAIPARSTAKIERGILLRADPSHFVALTTRGPRIVTGGRILPAPSSLSQYLVQPGLVVDKDSVRNPTEEEFLLACSGWFGEGNTEFKVGYMYTWMDPALVELIEQIPEFIAKQNEILKAVDAEILFAVPMLLAHNLATKGSEEVDVVGPKDSLPFEGTMLDGVTMVASYFGPGLLVEVRLEHTAVGPLGVCMDGRFVASRHCQRVAPYAYIDRPVGERQFSYSDNKVSLLDWLAGPGAEKYLGTKSSLKKYKSDPGAPHRQMEEIRQAIEAWSGAMTWERLTLAQAKEEAKAIAEGGVTKPPMYYFAANGRWFLMPFTKAAFARPDKFAVPMAGTAERVPEFQQTTLPTVAGETGYIVSDPLFEAYMAVADTVYKTGKVVP